MNVISQFLTRHHVAGAAGFETVGSEQRRALRGQDLHATSAVGLAWATVTSKKNDPRKHVINTWNTKVKNRIAELRDQK